MGRAGIHLMAGLCLAFGVVACGDEGQRSAPSAVNGESLRVATAEESLRPPGTVLAPGREVQPGSLLVGAALPLIDYYPEPGTASESLGWQAVLVVDGDPIAVWNRYVDHLGLPESARAERSCIVMAITPLTEETRGNSFVPPAKRFITDEPVDGENRIQCSVTLDGTTMALAVGAAPCLEAGCELRSVAHLYLGVDQPGAQPYEQFGTDQLRYERGATAAKDPNAVVEPLPAPAGQIFSPQLDGTFRSRLPGPGDRIDDGLDHYLHFVGMSVGVVPPKAHSLVAPAMLLQCNSGLVALLEAAGRPVDVVSTFDEADSRDDPIKLRQGTDPQGQEWAGGQITTAGGYYLGLVALQTGNDTSTVIVTECGD